MCLSVWSLLSHVFSWKFVCYLFPLQHDSTLKPTFCSKVFFEKWNGNENPKKKISAKRVGKGQVESGTTKWDKLGQVGVRGTSGTRGRGSSELRGTRGTRTRGLSTWTIPLVPNGTTRPHSSYSEGDHCPLSLSEGPKARTFFSVKGRRPALYSTVSLSEGPQARTFFSVIPTTPTRKWRWFHRVRCGWVGWREKEREREKARRLEKQETTLTN